MTTRPASCHDKTDGHTHTRGITAGEGAGRTPNAPNPAPKRHSVCHGAHRIAKTHTLGVS